MSCLRQWTDTRFLIVSPSIFISYSSSDQKVAETICDALQSRGYPCWIACRDIGPGENFQESIVKAIRSAKLMLLVFTSHANNSNEIKKEIVLAGRYHLTVVPVRVEDVVPNDALAYEFATRQWIDLFSDWERDIERLAAQIGSILAEGSPRRRQGRADHRKAGAASPCCQEASVPPTCVALASRHRARDWRGLPVLAAAASPPLLPGRGAGCDADDRAWSDATNVGTIRRSSNIREHFQMGVTSRRRSNEFGRLTTRPGRMPSAAGTIVALNKYLAQFPEGAHAAQAQRSIAGLERQVADQNHSSDKTHFDGAWLTTISCSNAAGAQGYSIQITSR